MGRTRDDELAQRTQRGAPQTYFSEATQAVHRWLFHHKINAKESVLQASSLDMLASKGMYVMGDKLVMCQWRLL
jgi:hypothetical protein